MTSLLEVDGCPPIKLREERDNEDVPLRTGCRVWSCARLLAEWLANRSGGGEDDGAGPIVVGRDVLELGAGTGAVGLTCAALGASSVTMTDRDEATLALMHTNARINGHYDASSTCEVCIQVLDWGDPATFIQGASYDLIVAADVLYLPEHCAALPDAVAAHLAPGGKVAVACGLRRRGLLDALVDSLRSVGLDPSVERETLGLDPSGGDARNRRAAAVTASEHAHDGAQISAAGGYVLVTAAAAADWKPPERLSARAVADAKRGREEEERNEASRREEEERNEASRPRIRGEGNRIVGARRSEERKGGDGAVASETAATREEDRDGEPGEIDSDANSAMGDFLDDFEDLGVDAGAPVTRAVPAADDDDEEEADLPPYRVHPSPAEVASGAPSASTIVAAADSLARNGFVVLEAEDGAGLVASDVLDSALAASDGYLDRLLAAAKAKGLRVDSDIFRFAELCSRARGGRRFDVTAERRRCGNDGSITLPPRPYPTSDDESGGRSRDGCVGRVTSRGGPLGLLRAPQIGSHGRERRDGCDVWRHRGWVRHVAAVRARAALPRRREGAGHRERLRAAGRRPRLDGTHALSPRVARVGSRLPVPDEGAETGPGGRGGCGSRAEARVRFDVRLQGVPPGRRQPDGQTEAGGVRHVRARRDGGHVELSG